MTYKKSHVRAATDDTLGQDCKHRLQRAEALGTAARQDANANDDGSGEEVRKDKVQTQGAGEKHRQQYFGNVSFTPGFSLSLLGEPLAGFWALWGG
jgi:hypothetical protein